MPEYIGKAQAAKMIGINRGTLDNQVLRGTAPAPDAKTNGCDVWLVETIRAYAEERKKKK